ncbi:myrosinase 1-like isoform X1 [Frankliniella occidentalis]|uniref:Myrosinase 1-like isoform X1 n=1 Tax=Frankliniella occidentalis TaxID=133901 RepID=A0A9C6WW35_FRAOC|nr:myrosinase 1-like isoform X1 [Frankliniella occidentalis]
METDSDSTSASPSLATSTQSIDTSAETSPSEIFTEQSTSTATTVYSSIATQHQTKPTTVNTVGPISLSTEQQVTDNGNTETNSEESMSTTTSFYSSLATELRTKPSTETLVTESGSTPAALVTTNTNTPPFSFTPYFSTERSTSQTMTTQSGITDFSPLTDQTFISTERLTTYNGYTVPHLTSSVSDSSAWDTSTDAYIVSSAASQSFPEQLTTSAITYSTSLATELETESTMSAQSDTAALTTLTTINSSEDFTTDMSTKADRSSTTETLTPSTASSGVSPSGAREDFFTPNASVSDDLYIMPTNFRLGATSSAYQTEGAWDTDGKGPSIQDNFYHGSGGDSGDIACNSYAEYLVDVNLLRNMSFQTYHFSMSWSRLLPTGSSLHANQVAINFYDKLLSALIENHIEPVVTLHHWDIPSGIVNGWLNSSAPDYFLDYATFAFSLFGSRVSTWLLLHDPVTLCVQGYAEGQIGPGIVDSQGTAAYRCVHNQILAHAQAYRAYRRDFADWQQGRVGSTLFLDYGQPQNASSAADAAAAERFMEASFAWVADPLFTGRYPDSLRQAAGDKLPSFTPAQMALVTGSTDFLGLKHSSARLCTEGQRTAQISFSNDVNVATRLDEKWLRTPGGQDAITPWSIRGALNWIDERYNGVQVLVTENGYSGSADNDIDDVKRSAYFSAYLRGVMRAVNEDRCNVMGYAARSLTDSFEWNNGYNVKYGLAHVDFSSGSRPRLLKPAPASFFRNVLQNRAVDFVAFISP